jgi:hypothetical protein
VNAKRRVIPIAPDQEPSSRISEAEFLAGLVSKTAKIQEKSAARAMTNRIPVSDYFRIKALSDYSGLSINQTVVHLLRVGLEALADELPDDDLQAVLELADRSDFADRGSPDREQEQYDSKGESQC